MNFAEYLQFVEAMTLSAKDLDFEVHDGLVSCGFEHDGNQYEVKMSRALEQGVDYVWTVYFTGPRGTSTTKSSGTSSTAIYNKLLSCVQKLFKTQKVNGLYFSPAESGMTIPYDLFYRSFLRPDPPRGAGFLMVSPNLYLSKEKVKELDIVANVLPANRVQMAKVELVKIDKAIKRIHDRIKSGTGFATDLHTLNDLAAKRNEILNKYQKTEKDYNDTLFRTRDRREQARIAAERESNRIREEEAREKERVRAMKVENIKSFLGKTLVMRNSLPQSELVSLRTMNILASAPWISIDAEDIDYIMMTFGKREMGEGIAERHRVYFEEADYIVSNFVKMDAKEKRRLGKRIYSALMNNPETDTQETMEDAVYKLPDDLRVQIANIGNFTRGFEKTKKAVKGVVKDMAQVPMHTYRYWAGKPDPEEVRARERDDIW